MKTQITIAGNRPSPQPAHTIEVGSMYNLEAGICIVTDEDTLIFLEGEYQGDSHTVESYEDELILANQIQRLEIKILN